MTAPDPTAGEHHPNCYQNTGVPDDMPAGICDCRVLRMLDAASPPTVAASTGRSEDVDRAAVDEILALFPMDGHGTGHIADCGYDANDERCDCYTLPERIANVLAAREAAARAEGAAAVRDDIRARRREFRRLNADREYLNALDDAYGLAANRAREVRP